MPREATGDHPALSGMLGIGQDMSAIFQYVQWFCFGCSFEIFLCPALFGLQVFNYDEFFLQIYSDWLWANSLMSVDSERPVLKQVIK